MGLQTIAYLKWIQQRCFARNLTKVLFTALKDQKSSHDNIKENLCFKQLRLNYINNQKKPKEHLRLRISSIRVGAVAKTDDEIYVLSTIKIYSYFSFVFYTVSKKVELLKLMQLLWEEENKFFGQSLLHPVVFQKRKYSNCLISYIMIAWGCRPWNTTNTTAGIYLSKTAIKTLKQNVKLVQIY